MRVPWTARRSNQSILKEISPGCSLEGMMLKLNIQKTEIMASGPITSWQVDGETVNSGRLYFGGATKSLQMVTAAMKLKDAYSLEGTL